MSHPPTRSRRRQIVALVAAGTVAGSLTMASSAGAQTDDQYIAEYADALFQRSGTTLRIAPGEIHDQGTITEVLEASVVQEACEGRFLITVDVSVVAEAPDIPGVEVDARAGVASVSGTFTLTGEVTITPTTGRRCATPNESAATTAPLSTDITVDATWVNLKGSIPVTYSGADCGGDGVCYYRDATARATWASDFIGSANAMSTSGFFFEGIYSAGDASLARIPVA